MTQDLPPASFDTPGPWTLVVSVPSGDLHVRTHPLPRTDVEILNVREPQDIVVRADEGSREVSITQNRRGRFNWRGSSCNLTVVVPEGTVVRVQGEALDTDVSGRTGSLTVNTASGDVRVEHVDGDLRTHSASGDLSADHVSGSLLVRSASGDLRVGRADGDVTVQSVSGDVIIERLSAGRTSVHSVSGDIDLGVLPGLQVHLELSSVSGTARPELDMGSATGDDGAPVDVALEIAVRTVSGDMRVRRSTAVYG